MKRQPLIYNKHTRNGTSDNKLRNETMKHTETLPKLLRSFTSEPIKTDNRLNRICGRVPVLNNFL